MKTIVHAGLMTSCNSRVTMALTKEAFEETVCSQKVKDIMEAIEKEPDKKEKSSLKQKLPVIMFQVCCEDGGKRPKLTDNPTLTGLVVHDFDNLNTDVNQLYCQKVSPIKDEIGLVVAHITPRGNGLRLVTEAHPGESIIECQRRVGEKLGLRNDESVKDATRLSFVPAKNYFLYIDSEKLFQRTIDVDAAKKVKSAQKVETKAKEGNEKKEGEAAANLPENNAADVVKYEGVPYSRIIEELLKRFATDGKPREGERNNDLYLLVNQLCPLANKNFDVIYTIVKPYFKDMQDNELRRTITSAIDHKKDGISTTLHQIIFELRAGCMKGGMFNGPKITTIPSFLRTIVSCYPERFREPVIMSSLAFLGICSTNIRSKYINNRIQSTTFLVHSVGTPASGKSYVNDLYQKLISVLNEQDNSVRDEMEVERLARNDARSAHKKMPRANKKAPRIVDVDATVAVLHNYLKANEKVHMLMYSEEIQVADRGKSNLFRDIQTILLKAYDNAKLSHDTLSDETANTSIEHVLFNICTAGTPDVTRSFFTVENGLASRIVPCVIEDNPLEPFPIFQEFTDEQQEEVEEIVKKLSEGTNNETLEYVDLPKTKLAIQEFCNKQKLIFIETNNQAQYDFFKRAAEYGFRAALLCYKYYGEETDEIVEFAMQVINYVLDCQIYVFGEADEEMANRNKFQKSGKLSVNTTIFDYLPDTFTKADVENVCKNQGRPYYDNIIKRLVNKGLVRRIDNHYEKLADFRNIA